METQVSRRRLLQVGGVGAAASFAGCGYMDTEDGGAPADMSGQGPHTVAIGVAIDQMEMQAAEQEFEGIQQEAQEEFDAGEIDEEEAADMVEEAQGELQETQRQLLQDAIDGVEAHAEGTEALSVLDSELEFGLVLVEGSGDAIVGTLASEHVQAIVPQEEFEAIQGPQDDPAPEPEPEPEP